MSTLPDELYCVTVYESLGVSSPKIYKNDGIIYTSLEPAMKFYHKMRDNGYEAKIYEAQPFEWDEIDP